MSVAAGRSDQLPGPPLPTTLAQHHRASIPPHNRFQNDARARNSAPGKEKKGAPAGNKGFHRMQALLAIDFGIIRCFLFFRLIAMHDNHAITLQLPHCNQLSGPFYFCIDRCLLLVERYLFVPSSAARRRREATYADNRLLCHRAAECLRRHVRRTSCRFIIRILILIGQS